MNDTLHVYAARFKQDPAALEKSLDAPVLLYEPFAPKESDSEDEYRLRTVSGFSVPDAGKAAPQILEVRKSKDNAFQRGITVGRTGNNDLVLDDGSVSRFHAWFQRDSEQGNWVLSDSGSKNGTTVAGQRLRAKKPFMLVATTRIKFGRVEVTFLPASDFLKLLRVRLEE